MNENGINAQRLHCPNIDGAQSGPVKVSYFDPRTGKPCAKKPRPLGKFCQIPVRRMSCGTLIVAPNRRGRPVLVDGLRYESIAAAARANGIDKNQLGLMMNKGVREIDGRIFEFVKEA